MTNFDDIRSAADLAEIDFGAAVLDRDAALSDLAEARASLSLAEEDLARVSAQASELSLANEMLGEALVLERAKVVDLQAEIDRLRAEIERLSLADSAVYRHGICVPWQLPDYADLDSVFAKLDWLGVKVVRGRYIKGARGQEIMRRLRQRVMKWIASFAPEDWFEAGAPTRASIRAQTLARVDDALAQPGADEVLIALEGPNEPNQGRSGAIVISDWALRCKDVCGTLTQARDTSGFDIPVTSPSMHVIDDTTGGGGGHWRELAAAGCTFDIGAVHSYPAGSWITTKLDERIGNFHSAYPGMKVALTEYGWVTDPPCTGTGPVLVTPEQQAAYAVVAIDTLEEHPDVVMSSMFELSDSTTGATNVQDCRGIERTTSGVTTWKPAGHALKARFTA